MNTLRFLYTFMFMLASVWGPMSKATPKKGWAKIEAAFHDTRSQALSHQFRQAFQDFSLPIVILSGPDTLTKQIMIYRFLKAFPAMRLEDTRVATFALAEKENFNKKMLKEFLAAQLKVWERNLEHRKGSLVLIAPRFASTIKWQRLVQMMSRLQALALQFNLKKKAGAVRIVVVTESSGQGLKAALRAEKTPAKIIYFSKFDCSSVLKSRR